MDNQILGVKGLSVIVYISTHYISLHATSVLTFQNDIYQVQFLLPAKDFSVSIIGFSFD